MDELYKNHIAKVISHWYKVDISEYADIDDFLVDMLDTLIVDNNFIDWYEEINFITDKLPIKFRHIKRTHKNEKVLFSVRYFFDLGENRVSLSLGVYNNIFDALDMRSFADIYIRQYNNNEISFEQLKAITNEYKNNLFKIEERRIFGEGL